MAADGGGKGGGGAARDLSVKHHKNRHPDGPLSVAERNAVVEECLAKHPHPVGLLRHTFPAVYHAAVAAGVDGDELDAVCRLALAEAARRYDPAKGAYSTIAAWELRASVQRLLLYPAHRDHTRRGGVKLVSLHEPLAADGGEVLDTLAGVSEGVDDRAGRAELSAAVLAALRRAVPSPRDRLAVEMRFGLNGHAEHTLEGVARELGVCKERARQLIARAVRQCREQLKPLAGTERD